MNASNEVDKINEKLRSRKCNIRVVVNKIYNYDTGRTLFDAWLEYFNTRRNSWGILHQLGKFNAKSDAIEAVKNKLHIDNYL